MKKLFILLSTQVFFLFSLQGQDLYITPNGSAIQGQPNAGSLSNPYNLDYVLDNNLVQNGMVLLLEGDFERSDIIHIENKDDLTITSYGNGATIKANEDLSNNGNIYLFSLSNSTNVLIKDIAFTGSQNENTNGFWLLTSINVSNTVFEGLTFEYNWGHAGVALHISGRGENITIKDCFLNNMGWTTDTSAVATFEYSSGIIVMGNENEGPYSNIIIENNSITNMRNGFAENITLTGNVDGFSVKENFLSDNGNIGIALAGHYSSVVDPDTSTVIQGELNQARNGIVERNHVIRSISPIAVSGGIYCDGCRNVTIQRNWLFENSVGVSVGCENGGDVSASDVKVINNLIVENFAGGLYIGAIGTSPSLSTVENCLIRNNTFYKNGIQGAPPGQVYVGRSSNNQFYNNILYTDTNASSIVGFCGADQSFDDFYMDYNLFYRENGDCVNLINDSCSSPLFGNENSQFGDPQFNNLTEFDISILSRAANSGKPETLPSDELDFDGDLRIFQSYHVDIGAQETISIEPSQSTNFFESNIVAFEIQNQLESIIDAENHTVEVLMPTNTDITSLAPEIQISCEASITPASTTTQDFTNPFVYQVVSGNGTSQDWLVIVEIELNINTEVSEVSKNSILVYPNPSSGIVSIEFLNYRSEDVNFNLYSLSGNLIRSSKNFLTDHDSQKISLELKDLADGLYFLWVELDKKRYTFKVVIDK